MYVCMYIYVHAHTYVCIYTCMHGATVCACACKLQWLSPCHAPVPTNWQKGTLPRNRRTSDAGSVSFCKFVVLLDF